MIYVDQLFACQKSAKWPYTQACHLMADSEDELHQFAARLGLRRSWYQNHHPNARVHHYDLTPGMRAKAIKLGAQEITGLDLYRRLFRQPARKVYLVGYSQPDSGQYVEQLMSHDQTLIMDCRITPWSRNPAWRKEALQAAWGKRYHYAGRYLGNAAHERNKANSPKRIGDKPYPNEIEIINPEVGIRGLRQYLTEGHDLILLCQCIDFGNCHLKEVTRLLVEAMPDVEIVRQGVSSHV